jgi:hypothetical protein
VASTTIDSMKEAFEGYADEDRLLAPHALQSLAFVAGIGGLLANAARTDRLPEGMTPTEVAMIGAATHKLSRILARAEIANFVRAPFTRYEGRGDLNEVNQEPRGRGLRRAMGELLACPLCLGAWVSGGMGVGLAYAPRFTRMVAGSFAALTISDFLHIAFAAAAREG